MVLTIMLFFSVLSANYGNFAYKDLAASIKHVVAYLQQIIRFCCCINA